MPQIVIVVETEEVAIGESKMLSLVTVVIVDL
jgi:hypothetical protein